MGQVLILFKHKALVILRGPEGDNQTTRVNQARKEDTSLVQRENGKMPTDLLGESSIRSHVLSKLTLEVIIGARVKLFFLLHPASMTAL